MVAVTMTATAKRFAVHWLRREKQFVVVDSNGVEVARTDDIGEAWLIETGLQREHDRRVQARRAEIEAAAAVRAARMRTAAARSRRFA